MNENLYRIMATNQIGIEAFTPTPENVALEDRLEKRRQLQVELVQARDPAEINRIMGELSPPQPTAEQNAAQMAELTETTSRNIATLAKHEGRRDCTELVQAIRNDCRQLLDFRVSTARVEARKQLEAIYALRYHRTLSRLDTDRTRLVDSLRHLHEHLNQARDAGQFSVIFEKISPLSNAG